MSLIQFTDVHKAYRMGKISVHALRGVSINIEPGEFVALMGPSGSGKSTLLHILGLLDVPDSGSYQLLGNEVSKLSDDKLASLRGSAFGFVFQQFQLLPRMTALENVTLPLIYYPYNNFNEARARKLLEDVGLGPRIGHKPNELSGGQQQRVAIARALINNPPIILADEPTGNLDSASGEELMGILSKLNEQGMTILLVTHEPEIAKYAHRIIRMRDGGIQSDERVNSFKSESVVIVSPDKHFPSKFHLMGIKAHFKQATRALFTNKIRSGLSMLGILIGVAAVLAMLALGQGAQQSIEMRLASMGSNLLVVRPGARQMHGVALEAGAVTRLTLEDAGAIMEAVQGVKRVAPSVSGRAQSSFGNRNWNTMVLGTTSDYAPMRASVPVVGRFFEEEDVRKRSRVAVLGMTPLRELFESTNPIGEFIKINKVIFQVIGILPEKGATAWRDQDDLIVIPVSTAMRRLLGRDYVDSIDVEVSSGEEMAAVQESIQDLVIRRHRLPPSQQDSFQIRNMAEIQAALSETSRTMSWLLASIATISLLVGGIGIMNIMLVSVTERTREIGLRKAVGATRRDIMTQFMVEALSMSLMGGMIGILLGWVITLMMSNLAGWAASVTLGPVLLAFFSAAVVGVIFGIWPARNASLLSPIDAIRYE